MKNFEATDFQVKCLKCGAVLEEKATLLECTNGCESTFIRAEYDKKQIDVKDDSAGLYKFSDWLPVKRTLEGSGAPITYRSEGLAKELGLDNLYVTFNGWWPEKGAKMKTGSFKECEAYSVCGRMGDDFGKVLVVASAGNTARAFARVCSENNIPLLLSVPEDNLAALWFDHEINDCVKLICPEKGSDYFDAISLASKACQMDMFQNEGGAKNIARRDGMSTTVLSAVTTIKQIPDYYFQAVGSGTGAIAAWEANNRFIEDGRFGNKKMKLMISQNVPFLTILDSWKQRKRDLVEMTPEEARKAADEINAKVLSNRKPPYSVYGGLYDALNDCDGEVLAVTNKEASEACKLFTSLEGNSPSAAASVAVASLINAVKSGKVEKESIINLNITGGGWDKFKKEHKIFSLKPSIVFPKDSTQEEVEAKLSQLKF